MSETMIHARYASKLGGGKRSQEFNNLVVCEIDSKVFWNLWAIILIVSLLSSSDLELK